MLCHAFVGDVVRISFTEEFISRFYSYNCTIFMHFGQSMKYDIEQVILRTVCYIEESKMRFVSRHNVIRWILWL